MLPRRVNNPPSAFFLIVVQTSGLFLQGRLLDGERVSGIVLRRTSRSVREGNDILFDDGVIQSIQHRVHADREQVLVIMRIDVGSDSRAESIGLAGICDIDLENTSKADLELDASVLVKEIVPDVFVIRKCADHADHEAAAAHSMGTASGAVIAVFP